jgi:hypothetical protein
MLGEEIPQRLLDRAVALLGEEVLRRLPAGVLFAQPTDFRGNPREVPLAGEVAQRGEIDLAVAGLARRGAVGRVGRLRLGRREVPSSRRAGLNDRRRRADRRQVDRRDGGRRIGRRLRGGRVGRRIGEQRRRRRLIRIDALRADGRARKHQHRGYDEGTPQKHCGNLS